MAAAHEPKRLRHGRRVRQLLDFRDEGACGVDDEPRVNAPLGPALIELDGVARLGCCDGRYGAAVEDVGAAGARIECHAQGEARVVGLAIGIVENGAEVVAAEPGKGLDLLG
ncbi:MAG: hypothetical protein R3D01_01055 [Hyphomicrobiales bacterium]